MLPLPSCVVNTFLQLGCDFFLTRQFAYDNVKSPQEVNKMQSINDRIAEIVRSTGKTKTAFAESLGVSQQYISKLEKTGTPSERTIRDICDKYNVNEYWLRTGEGEMFRERSRAEDLAGLLASMCENPTPFQKSLIAVLAKLDPSQWKLLEEKAMELFEEMQKEKADQ
jgi:transcriptional regulator with XRE-family HTH domain